MRVALALLLVGVVGLASASTTTLPLGTPLTSQQLGATDKKCYQLTLSDPVVREVVFWENPKLFLQLTPCKGIPHMKVSVYGCPSATKTVYEFMSDKMKNDAIAQGNSASIPKDWEWPGDVETLTIDITHKTYFIEIENRIPTGKSAAIPSEFELYVDRFDANGTTVGQPHSKEDLFPLKFMSRTTWDRKVARDNGTDADNSFSFGGGSSTNIVTVNFYPPGLPGAANPTPILSTPYEYSVFVLEITDAIGKSYDPTFSSLITTLGVCPTTGDACTKENCRTCSTDFPLCPKEFLTDCTETTLNVAKLKDALNATSKPFDAYVKDPTQWTAWTACGAGLTMNRIDGNAAYKTLTIDQRRVEPLAWFSQGGPVLKTNTRNQQSLAMQGLVDTNNNVYLVNVIVRKGAAASGTTTTTTTTTTAATNSTETAIYEFMTLQMRTPRYETPKLNDTDKAVIIGVSCGLGACIIIFVGVAILVRHKRKQKLAQRIRMKK